VIFIVVLHPMTVVVSTRQCAAMNSKALRRSGATTASRDTGGLANLFARAREAADLFSTDTMRG
jgi:hypothetical protein